MGDWLSQPVTIPAWLALVLLLCAVALSIADAFRVRAWSDLLATYRRTLQSLTDSRGGTRTRDPGIMSAVRPSVRGAAHYVESRESGKNGSRSVASLLPGILPRSVPSRSLNAEGNR